MCSNHINKYFKENMELLQKYDKKILSKLNKKVLRVFQSKSHFKQLYWLGQQLIISMHFQTYTHRYW